MKKAKKTKAPAQRTALDRITAQLRTVLRRETTNIILIGNLLIEARKHLEHGEWQSYLADNFDLSLRTAQNYYSAAEYVEKKQKQIGNIADFANLSASVLYHLAADHFSETVEAAILAEARERRVDEDAMWAIKDKVEPDDVADDADDDDQGDDSGKASDDEKEDAEAAATIERGTDPRVPPTADPPPLEDFDLRDFNQAIDTLNRLKTKSSAQFASTIHSADDLQSVEDFIRAVRQSRCCEAAKP
jgi:hypothetical protein